jgi:hypothetical protein
MIATVRCSSNCRKGDAEYNERGWGYRKSEWRLERRQLRAAGQPASQCRRTTHALPWALIHHSALFRPSGTIPILRFLAVPSRLWAAAKKSTFRSRGVVLESGVSSADFGPS